MYICVYFCVHLSASNAAVDFSGNELNVTGKHYLVTISQTLLISALGKITS